MMAIERVASARERPIDLGRLEAENERLRARLSEYEEVLRAIRCGEVDAFLVSRAGGERIVTVEHAEPAFRALVEGMSEGAAILDAHGTLLYANARMAELLHAPLESVMGASLFAHVRGCERKALEKLLAQAGSRACARELTLSGPDGKTETLRLSLSPIVFHKRPAISAVFTDLTARSRHEERLRSLSLVDELTGVLNRRGFTALAEQQLRLARRAKGELLLFFADIDGLKPINDMFGHAEGDRAIADAAAVLKGTFRECDVIGRLGGDEFAVLAVCTPGFDAEGLLARLDVHVREHNAAGNRPFVLGISLGLVRADPCSVLTIADLVGEADAEMYRQKRRRRGEAA